MTTWVPYLEPMSNHWLCWHAFVISALSIWREVDSQCSATSPPNLLGKLKASERPCLKNKMNGKWEGTTESFISTGKCKHVQLHTCIWIPLHRDACAHTLTCTHWQIHKDIKMLINLKFKVKYVGQTSTFYYRIIKSRVYVFVWVFIGVSIVSGTISV